MALFDLNSDQSDTGIQIPDPIAPARPTIAPVGQTVPFTTSTGITALMDSVGNIWNNAGQYIGKMTSQGPQLSGTPPLTVAGTAATSTTSSSSSTPGLASSLVTGVKGLATLENWAAGLVTRTQTAGGGLSLEDLVLIVLGLILLGGAVATFAFKGSETVVQAASSGVNRVSKTAGKATALAGKVAEVAA
jgi:hypothetical protein